MIFSSTYRQPVTKTFNFITYNFYKYICISDIIGSLYSLHNGFHSTKCTSSLLCLSYYCAPIRPTTLQQIIRKLYFEGVRDIHNIL